MMNGQSASVYLGFGKGTVFACCKGFNEQVEICATDLVIEPFPSMSLICNIQINR